MTDTLLVSTKKGLFALEPAGGGWRVARTAFVGENVTLAAADPHTGGWYAALNLGHFGVKVKFSPDRGETWEDRAVPAYPDGATIATGDGKPPAPATLKIIWALEPNGTGGLWAGTAPGGVFRSTDGGHKWDVVPAVAPSVFGFGVAVHPRDPLTAWFVPAVKDECRVPVEANVVVSRTRDGGRTFDVLRRGLPQEHAYDLVYRHGLAIDHTGDRLAFGSTTGGLWTTADQGDTWQAAPARLPPVHAVRFAA